MTAKRTKYRVGPFTHTNLHVEFVDADGNNVEQPGDIDAISEALEGVTPRGQVKRWRPHAERLNVAGDLLNEAESLIDDQDNVENMDRFTLLMAQIEITIERAQNEALDIYGKVGRQSRTQRERANKRWAERAEVLEIIKRLATRPEYQDYRPGELWDHLHAALDEAQLEPVERGHGVAKRYDYNDRDDERASVEYEAFRKQVNRARKNKWDMPRHK